MNSGESSPLLRHVERFGLTTTNAVEKIWKERGLETLQAHLESGELAICDHLEGGATVFERREQGPPVNQGVRIQRLLWLSFCVLGSTERRPITSQKLRSVYHDFTSGARHCTQVGDNALIWRAFFPTSHRADIQTARHIRQAYLHALRRLPKDSAFRALVTGGRYGFAVVMTDEKRASQLSSLLRERPLPDEVPILVEVIPEGHFKSIVSAG